MTLELLNDKDYEVLGKLIFVTPKYYTIVKNNKE